MQTCQQILLQFVEDALGELPAIYLKSHQFEIDLYEYARKRDVYYSPSTYSREWRRFREEQDLYDIDIIKGKENIYYIKRKKK